MSKGVPGLDWKQPPAKSIYKLERDERLKDVESYYSINPFSYPKEGIFKVYLDGMPNTKPVYWFYKKQFAELQLYDLDPGRSLACLRELYGPPTKTIRNETPEGIQQWDQGKVLIEYVRFANDKATIWVKYKELSKKISGN